MFYDFGLAWRGLRARPLQALIPAVIVGLAIGLAIAVFALGDGVRRGIVQASDPFGVLVIGPKGSGQQLVLNSVLLQGIPLGTIPYRLYEALAADPRVRLAVPLAAGDNLGNAPIIGTDSRFFALRPSLDAPPAFQIAEGRTFEAEFEAVLGAKAAEDLGLATGDRFRAAHGFSAGIEDAVHDSAYTIVGVLAPSGTPYDNAVYTSVESVWAVHAPDPNAPPSPFEIGAPAGAADRLTSILVQPVGFVEQNQLWQEFYTGTEAQAAFPGQEIGGLFDLLGQAEQVLGAVGYLVLVIAALTVFLSIYSATLNRQRDLAVMRSLGGGRLNVFRVVIFETLIVTLAGALLGRLIGYGVAAALAGVFTARSAIPLPVRYLPELDAALWLAALAVALLAGLLPSALAYHVDVVRRLSEG